MLNMKELVRAMKNTEGCRRFDAKSLRISLQDFQLVVELIREADERGFFETVKAHDCSATGLVDCMWVEGLTSDGEEFLNSD